MLLSGTLADLDLPSIAAMTSLGRSSLRLELRESGGDLIGSLVLKAGRVVSATAGSARGRDALRVLLGSASDVRFQLAQEPLDFAMSSALASVDELGELRRRGALRPARAATSDDDETEHGVPLNHARGTTDHGRGARGRAAPSEAHDTTELGIVSPRPGRATTSSGRATTSSERAASDFGVELTEVNPGSERGVGATINGDGTRLLRNGRARSAGSEPRVAMMHGRLDEFDLLTLLQTVGVGRQLVELEIRDRATRPLGTILVKSGKVLSAQAGDTAGIDAIAQLIRIADSFEFTAFRVSAELGAVRELASVTEIGVRFAAAGALEDDDAGEVEREDLAIMEGALADFDLPTLLHTIGCSRQYCALEVHDERTSHGTIFVKSGLVLAATAGSLSGVPAMKHLIATRSRARFRLIQLAGEIIDDAPLGRIDQLLLHVDAPAPAPVHAAGTGAGAAAIAPTVFDDLTRPALASDAAVMEGKLADFDVRTVLEVLAATRQHARLVVLAPDGRPLGEVTLKAGWIISSQAATLRGRDALVFLLAASPACRFRVLTLPDGASPEETIGEIHDVLRSIPLARPARAESSTRMLRWAIPLSFAVGGAIVFLVTRGPSPRPEPRPAPAVQRELAPSEPAAPPPSPGEPLAPAPSPTAVAAPTGSAPSPAAVAAPAGSAPSPTAVAAPAGSAPSPAAVAAPTGSAPSPPADAAPAATAPRPAAPAMPSGVSIRNAQAAFRQLGYDPGPLDNVMGRQTRNAILRFQRAQRLPVTGLLDEQTWSALVGQLVPARLRR